MANPKNLPEIYNPRAFGFTVIGEPFTPHQRFIEEVNYNFPHPHDLIDAGENPFKAYREDHGEETYNVAEILDCDVYDYILMEEGEVDISADDILRFCQNFNIQPYDLIPRATQNIDAAMLDAMMQVRENRSILSTSNEDTFFKLNMMLVDEVLPIRSVDRMRRIRDRVKDNSNYALTVVFLDEMIAKDGNKQMQFVGEVAEILGNLIDSSIMSLPVSDRLKESLEAKKDKAWKNYNALGNRLYRENWVTAHERLWLSKKVIGSDKRFCDEYNKKPSVLGEDRWPSHGGTITHDGRHMDWKQAHKRHVIELRRYLDARTQIKDFDKQQKNTRNQVTTLENWTKLNQSLLMKYQNRQALMQHMDFVKYRSNNEYVQSARQYFLNPVYGLKSDRVILSFADPRLSRMLSPR